MSGNREDISRRGFIKLASAFTGFTITEPIIRNYLSKGYLSQFEKESLSSLSSEERDFIASHEVFTGDKDSDVVCMTYDDFNFNRPKDVDIILDAYKSTGAKASFFFPASYSRKYEPTLPLMGDQIQRIVTEGHIFGCHGFIHHEKEPLTTLSGDGLRKDIERWLKIVSDIIPGYEIRWMRYPFGDRNQKTRDIFAEYGMQSVMWSEESGGEDSNTLERVIKNVRVGDIVLSHANRCFDVIYTGRIIENLQSKGFSLKSVSNGLSKSDYFSQSNQTKKRGFSHFRD